VATFAPHAPFTPARRFLGTYHEKAARTPAFNVASKHAPAWLAAQKLTASEIASIDTNFNKRVEAVQAVDELIGTLLLTLAARGLDDHTYVIFSSDNGFHMGEHKLFQGKQTAFETDINVPLIVVGPGVPAGAVEERIVENIDLCPTFAELGGTAPPDGADGHSLVPLLSGMQPADWRNVALIEHHGPDFRRMALADPDNDELRLAPAAAGVHPAPTSYEAIRMLDSVYVSYASGETEYYDLRADPFELDNAAGKLTAAQKKSFAGTVQAIANCHGAAACWKAEHR
jgi:arylsulfatase A-like enzyme